MHNRIGLRAGALAATVAAAAWSGHGSAMAAEQAMIVLDASGSMWGQIDGTPKIVIAREVLDRTIGSANPDVWLGLMAYGHREKGSCADIEILYMPAPSSGPEIAGTARDLNPKGKTPLSEAVRQAAIALNHTAQKATVILVTDGLETCNADPCALARELEQSGVDFTAHVLGFGLSPEEGQQVACIADETGGSYFQASDADGLAEALASTVAEASLPAPSAPEAPPDTTAELPSATIEAPAEVEIGAEFAVAWDGPGGEHDHIWLFDPLAADGAGEIVRGRRLSTSPDFDARTVTLVAPATVGRYELQYHYGAAPVVIATRPIAVIEAAVRLAAPAAVGIGSRFEVGWVGPGGNRDFVELFDESTAPGRAVATARLINFDFANRTISLTAPVEPGFYLLRYVDGAGGEVLASRQIEILPAEVSLAAPDTVDAGALFQVVWQGPGANRDQVEIYDGNAGKVVATKRLVNDDYANRTATLKAPAAAGAYLLRYFNGDSRAVLAERPLAVH